MSHGDEDLSLCLDCNRPTVWVRRTQFCGDHPFCDEHARKQGDFGREDPSYFFWECVSSQRLPAGKTITALEVEGVYFVQDGQFPGQETKVIGADPRGKTPMAAKSRCWVLEVGGDRCVLRADHPGPHMGGHHQFDHLLDEEGVARVLGPTIDLLRDEVYRLRKLLKAVRRECQVYDGTPEFDAIVALIDGDDAP